MPVQSSSAFPKPLAIDWDHIRTRYLAGESPKLIAQAIGVKEDTLFKRAKREKWKRASKLPVTAVLSSRIHDAVQSVLSPVLSAVQDEWKRTEHTVALKALKSVEKRDFDEMPSRDLAHVMSAADVASRIGRRALDMDTEGQVAAFASGLCSGMQIQRGPAPVVEQPAQVIEVQSDAVSTDHGGNPPS